jgi:hypothetical protein
MADPENLNLSYTTDFKFQLMRFPDLTFFCTGVVIPGINVNAIALNTPHATLPMAGSKIVYSPLTINFLVNENLSGYREIAEWLQSLAGSPGGYDQYAAEVSDLSKDEFSDGILTILSNKKNPICRVKFGMLVPTSISEIKYDNMVQTAIPISAYCTFAVGYFVFETV